MSDLLELEKLMNFVKGKQCSLDKLQELVKQQNENAKVVKYGRLIFLQVGKSQAKAILGRAISGKWYVL